MAIDTPNKRASVQAYGMGYTKPIPDGTIDEQDRAFAGAWLYAGLDYFTPSLIKIRRRTGNFIMSLFWRNKK